MYVLVYNFLLLSLGNSGDTFEDLSEGVHSITIQFTQNGSTPIDCLIQNFTISRSSKIHVIYVTVRAKASLASSHLQFVT